MTGLDGMGTSNNEFIKAFKTISSEKIHTVFIKEDGTALIGLMGKLAESGRYLLLPTVERMFIDPKIYRDPFITKQNWAIVFEKNIRCIDVTEYGRTRDAIKFSNEAYNVLSAQFMSFLKPASNLYMIVFFALGWSLGMVLGMFTFWAMF